MADAPNEPQPNPQREQSFEIGMDEAWKVNAKALFDAWFANMKRTYDEYQSVDLATAKNLNAVTLQAVQNAVENANLATKQYLKEVERLGNQHTAHRDIATNKVWNLEPSEAAGEGVVMRSITLDDASLKAIGAAVAAAVASAINPPKPTPAA